ncbi:P-loop containing nucleoside triphosphate hydrolase protein [Tothia fuscella]|uniref:P-loop containing nucleoside triphosphate hydrolase protein n=1 Tax=Tothia fuscella TaxID=1048955 RepID=A0A9P4U0P4_9PEZI|nr:P-loop containing nucleoside triphosphate hydrolase protein [Tothia fuscella]
MVDCPICGKNVKESTINSHLDSQCQSYIITEDDIAVKPVAGFFQTPAKRTPEATSKTVVSRAPSSAVKPQSNGSVNHSQNGAKRPLQQEETTSGAVVKDDSPPAKKEKLSNLQKVAPLAERMRPRTLDEVIGQELVGPKGVIRGLIAENRVPSMILWGGPGTGKTTISRLIAHAAGCRFVEINSTSSGVQEVKRLFAEAKSELNLTGRKTIIFCDEIHRFNKAQQDVFLGPVESGMITLIGATTENPSFKVVNALMSRCRTFTLSKLTDETIVTIMDRAIAAGCPEQPPPLLDRALLDYLAAFSDGDARTALNLLELALDLSKRPEMTQETLKKSLTQTLVYDRNGDQHYDTISAFHKSIRGSDPDAALYYLARMLQSGEDPLYVARRLIVIASEDIGLADNTMLPLAIAAYTAAEKVGMPEARINLAHATVAFALAPKSTKAYRGLGAAMAALKEPGIAGLPVPMHLRNAPTRLMKELGYGKEYKYNPEYVEGRISQEYLPEKLRGKKFLEDKHLGTKTDSDLEQED